MRHVIALALAFSAALVAQGTDTFGPGRRVLLDAHNAYPYQERWSDRTDRALTARLPIAIEQDLVWRPAASGDPAHSIVSHGEPFTGREPALRDFFERIRPLVTRALVDGPDDRWPLITLNLDFKDSHPEHFEAIWASLGDYESWLTTARKSADENAVQPLDVRPVLVLTGADPAQRLIFHDALPVGSRLRLFGAVPAGAAKATNYLRWSNNPWNVVEPEGQNTAGEWSTADQTRLRDLVTRAHDAGLWIRFYTLNGHSPEHGKHMGYTPSYNFGSLEAVRHRWRAAIAAGVDFVATDQYEEFAKISSH